MDLRNLEELRSAAVGILTFEDPVRVVDADRLRERLIEPLVRAAVLAEDPDLREAARTLIRGAALAAGAWSASIQDLYEARGRGEVAGFTVPAINIRGLTYDVARAAMRAAAEHRVGAVVFEIARSEIGYTQQRPAEYAAAVLAAAVREGYRGPVFLQGDHFQISARKYSQEAASEVRAVKDLIQEAIAAGFLNIDIDTSTLVDLSRASVPEQQRQNFALAAELTAHVRALEPRGVTISVGGEIGEVGKQNSTVEELCAYMDGYRAELERLGRSLPGISKISVQTGTTHGGVPLADGSVASVKVDFEVLRDLSRVAREAYGLAGAVQHGASTLPEAAFDRFPRVETAEIHLATGFQNQIYDHPAFPEELRREVRDYCFADLAAERSSGETDEQFLYKTRKKAFGPFKRRLWDLPASVRGALGESLEDRFGLLFRKLAVEGTREMVNRIVRRRDVPVARPAGL